MHLVRKVTLAIASGLLLSLGWTKLAPGLIVLVALLPLLFLEGNLYKHKDKNRSYHILPYTLLSFGIWNGLTVWWIWNAAPIGAIAAVIINTSLMSLVFWLFHLSKRLIHERASYFALLFLWIGFEYFHARWELNFPWLSLGNGLGRNIHFIQWYEYTGVLGGSFWILISNILLYKAIHLYIKFQTTHAAVVHFAIWLLVILIPSWISFRMFNHYEESGETRDFVVVQPNIDPYNEKFSSMSMAEQVNKILRISQSQADSSVNYFIGPETALPEIIPIQRISRNASFLAIRDFMHQYPHANYLIGAQTRDFYPPDMPDLPVTARKIPNSENYYDNFNTALFIPPSGDFETYHKSKLVVGVEKMPFPKTMKFLEKLIINLGGTTGSLGIEKEAKVFTDDDGFKLAPIICYESIYGEYVNEYVRKGANYLVVITNDGWWGDTQGYKQHWRFSQIRAIETRRAVARSANTGISGFINQKGEILTRTDYWVEDCIRAELASNDKITVYVKYGDFIGRIFGFTSVLLILYLISLYIISKKNKLPD